MEILLVQDVPNLGVLGDQIKVKSGYGRNYLIPQGKAILATGKKSKELQHRMQFYSKLRQAAIDAAQEKADSLKLLKFEITKKAGLGGRLFGSVTNKDITSLLMAQGYEVTRQDVFLHRPIKTVGSHGVIVKLHTSVKVDIEIKVIADATSPQTPVVEEEEPSIDASEVIEEKSEAIKESDAESSEE